MSKYVLPICVVSSRDSIIALPFPHDAAWPRGPNSSQRSEDRLDLRDGRRAPRALPGGRWWTWWLLGGRLSDEVVVLVVLVVEFWWGVRKKI